MLLIWSPYHFSDQSVGITLICRDAGFQVGKWERMAIGVYLRHSSAKRSARGNRTGTGSGIKYPGLGLPEWPSVSKAVVGRGAAFCISRCWSIQQAYVAADCAAAAVTQYVGSCTARNRLAVVQEFVPFFHSLPCDRLGDATQGKDGPQALSRRRSTLARRPCSKRLNMIVRAFLFWVLPRWSPCACRSITTNTDSGSTAGHCNGHQIHHFFVDGFGS